MPEATVDEDGYPPSGKDDVGLDKSALDPDSMVLSKPVPEAVESRSKCNFGLGVTASYCGHVPRAAGRRLESGPSDRGRRAIATVADHAVRVRPGD